MKKANLAVGILGILLSAYVIITAAGFPENRSAVDPGAAYFPTLMAAFMAAMCILLIAATLLGTAAGQQEKFAITQGVKRAGVGVIIFVVYCFLFKPLGFVLDTIWFCFACMMLLQNRKYGKMAIVSVLTGIVIYVIFANLLGAKLPAGLLKGLL